MHQRLIILFIAAALVAAALAGCGGSSPAPTAEPTLAPTAAPQATTAPTAEAPTAAPPTATPVPPTAAPTTAPTATPAPPTPTAEPTATPKVALSDCDNPYFPVSDSMKWRYKISGDAPSEFTESHTNITESSFVLRREFSSVTAAFNYKCTKDGLTAAELGGLQMEQSQIKLQFSNVQGVTIPAADQWKVGASWNSSYEVAGEMTAGGGVKAEVKGAITISSKITGKESVTVPAGSYDAFKVESEMVETMNVTANGVTLPDPVVVNLNSTAWYAKDVGMVKSSDTSEALNATTELTELTK